MRFDNNLTTLYKGLLLLQGHPIQPNAADAHAPAQTEPSARVSRNAGLRLFESLLFLGGRPMHPDRPFDLEEPFDQLREPCADC